MSFNEDESMNKIHIVKSSREIKEENESSNVGLLKLKVYKRRWLMLTIYMICTIGSTFQWLEYGIITNIVARYYGVPSLIVEWTSMLSSISYMVFIFPVSYLTNKYSLRWIFVVSSGLSWLGAFIKLFSVHPDRFYLIIIGKSITTIAQTIFLSTHGQMAAQWFPFHELSTATGLGFSSSQLGIGCSFFFPSIIVKNHESLDDIGNDLSRLVWIITIITTIGFFLMLILFQHEPKISPSETRALQKINRLKRDDKYIETIKRLLKNRNFIIYCNVYGLNTSALISLSTLLNPIILEYFQNAEDAGRIGAIMIISGLIGGTIAGIMIDKMHKFKEIAVILCFLRFFCYTLFMIFVILQMRWMAYILMSLLGTFAVGYMAMGYEICVEYTYPEPEYISMGIMNAITHMYITIIVIIAGILLKMYGSMPYLIGTSVVFLLGSIFTILMKNEQRRQDAKKMVQTEGLRIIERNNIDDIPETNTFVRNVN